MKIFYSYKRMDDFIKILDKASLEALMRSFSLLQSEGHALRMLHSRGIGGGLFELRVPCDPPIRAIFGFHSGRAFIVHVFFKKTMRIPRNEIEYARLVWKNSIA